MPTALRRSDLTGALDFVRDAGEASDPSDFRQRVMQGLPRLVPSYMTSYTDMSVHGAPMLLLDPPDAITPEFEEAFVRFAGQNPLIAHYAATGERRPMKISDLMARRAFRATDLYRTVYGPMGVEYQMALPLPAEPGAVVGIALNRDRRDFGERDRQVLELLAPHLARLRQDAATRAALALVSSLVDRALGDEGRAAVAVGRDARVAYASAGAEALLRAHLAPPRRADLLPARLEDWLLAERRRGLRAPADLVLDGPGGRLIARLLPSGDREGHDVVLLEEHRLDRERVALAGLGLSARQGEVLSLVARGRNNREVAEVLGVSPRTVQKHLENIYDRLGVRSRAAATARAVAAVTSRPT